MGRSARGSSLVVLGSLVCVLAGASVADAQFTLNKCVAGKFKCVGNLTKGLLNCHKKAEQKGVPPNDKECIDKALAKYNGGSDSTKGCFAKLEAKYTSGPDQCLTTGDTATLQSVTVDYVDDVVLALDPGFPTLVINACSAGKKNCVSKYATGLLKCEQKARQKGISANADGCMDKALTKYDGGADPSKGCFAKLEAKYPVSSPDMCLTYGDEQSLEDLTDEFDLDVAFLLDPNFTTTTSTSTTTSSSSSTTTSTSTTVTTSTSSTVTTSSSSSTSSTSSSTSTSASVSSTSSTSSSTSTTASTSSTSSTTSTSSSTTVVTTTSTTTTTAANPTLLDFTSTAGGGVCGQTFSNTAGTGAPLSTISCGGLKLGGGSSIVGENVTPDGFTNRFALSCTGPSCNVSGQAMSTADYECSNTGCRFGTPLPLSAAGISSCIYNTFTAPVTGTLNTSTGAASLNIALSSATRVTGNATRPCPVCVDGSNNPVMGSPSSPQSGTCDRGPNAGQACTTRNSQGLTYDCQTDGTDAGAVAVDLSPVVTQSLVQTAQNRIFCPDEGQNSDDLGCFQGGLNCRRIEVNGTPAATPVTLNTPSAVRLASIFCVPVTENPTVNFSADLPGPGATIIVGNFTTRP